jgi:hypothetical protein
VDEKTPTWLIWLLLVLVISALLALDLWRWFTR